MVLRSDPCDPRRLDLFLRNRLPEDSQQDLEAHLLLCPACRNQLDALAGGPRWWAEVERYLGGEGAAESLPTSDQSSGPPGLDIDLSFLQPSENPASLGRLGIYEVLEVLGQGGMGVVLKAFDPALHRPVAIKVLAASYAGSGAARKRFAREAQAVAAVIHDHVVPVHAVDPDATPPYLVMAFIPGQSLQQRLDRSGPLDVKEILRIGMQTASGLAAAHAQGLVHRDIKPANIMLENGVERVRITDFGLARALGDASVTQNGAVAGTPHYMAPEQARGEAVDQRADLFALGSTLYTMCTGRAPFRGDFGLAVIRQVCDVEPAPIRSINPDIPVWLAGIIHKLHAKDPAQRFQSAGEVAELLERALAHLHQPDRLPLPFLAEELGRQVPGSGSPRRRRRSRRAAAALAAVVLAAAAVLFWPGPAAKQPRVDPERSHTGSTAAIIPEEVGSARFDEEVRDRSRQVRARVDDLRQALSAPAPGERIGLEPALDRVRQGTEMLGRDVRAGAEASPDPVQAQLENIGRRLQLLQQRVGRGPE
jgi:serine/threonine-protein kinase